VNIVQLYTCITHLTKRLLLAGHTGVFEEVICINNDGFMAELLLDEFVQLEQFLEAHFARREVVPACTYYIGYTLYLQ
jgi:hypothetical protein